MPALSPTMETGKITEWFFKEGDEVCEGDTLADIETDKSTVGFETTDGGYIAKILYDSGLDLAVGKVSSFSYKKRELLLLLKIKKTLLLLRIIKLVKKV